MHPHPGLQFGPPMPSQRWCLCTVRYSTLGAPLERAIMPDTKTGVCIPGDLPSSSPRVCFHSVHDHIMSTRAATGACFLAITAPLELAPLTVCVAAAPAGGHPHPSQLFLAYSICPWMQHACSPAESQGRKPKKVPHVTPSHSREERGLVNCNVLWSTTLPLCPALPSTSLVDQPWQR